MRKFKNKKSVSVIMSKFFSKENYITGCVEKNFCMHATIRSVRDLTLRI